MSRFFVNPKFGRCFTHSVLGSVKFCTVFLFMNSKGDHTGTTSCLQSGGSPPYTVCCQIEPDKDPT